MHVYSSDDDPAGPKMGANSIPYADDEVCVCIEMTWMKIPIMETNVVHKAQQRIWVLRWSVGMASFTRST